MIGQYLRPESHLLSALMPRRVAGSVGCVAVVLGGPGPTSVALHSTARDRPRPRATLDADSCCSACCAPKEQLECAACEGTPLGRVACSVCSLRNGAHIISDDGVRILAKRASTPAALHRRDASHVRCLSHEGGPHARRLVRGAPRYNGYNIRARCDAALCPGPLTARQAKTAQMHVDFGPGATPGSWQLWCPL